MDSGFDPRYNAEICEASGASFNYDEFGVCRRFRLEHHEIIGKLKGLQRSAGSDKKFAPRQSASMGKDVSASDALPFKRFVPDMYGGEAG